jgi:hypothetical protein
MHARPRLSEETMPRRFRLSRRVPVATTEDRNSKIRGCAAGAGLGKGAALSVRFETFASRMDAEGHGHRPRLFDAELDARKR